VSDDYDDTVIAPPRPPVAPAVPDTDDTVIAPPVLRRRIDHATGLPIDEPHAAPEPEVEPEVAASAPLYYAFRVGLGTETVLLDVPCYVGRNPSAPRVTVGHPPRLVRVPSALREVSATHLELRQVGSTVVVTDVKSTNGSIVMIPGSVPRKLRQGESVVVSPGTLVDIGDGNIVQVLSMQRRISPAERQS